MHRPSQIEQSKLLSTAENLGLLAIIERLLVTDPGKVTALSIPFFLASAGKAANPNRLLQLHSMPHGRALYSSGYFACRHSGLVSTRQWGTAGLAICSTSIDSWRDCDIFCWWFCACCLARRLICYCMVASSGLAKHGNVRSKGRTKSMSPGTGGYVFLSNLKLSSIILMIRGAHQFAASVNASH